LSAIPIKSAITMPGIGTKAAIIAALAAAATATNDDSSKPGRLRRTLTTACVARACSNVNARE
jgi:hypothetical protein